MDDNKIGMNIKKYRKGKFTQQELADKIGKTESSIRKYEKGLVTIPLDVLNRIASALEVKVADLMGISDYMNSIENEMRQATNFYDYLASLGYIILEIDHKKSNTIYLKTPNKDIELSSDDVKLLKELEDSTNKDIKRTIELLIATKSK